MTTKGQVFVFSKKPNAQPTVTCYLNKSTGYWHANVYWGAGERVRPSLGVRTENEALDAFEKFKLHDLPGMIADHALRVQALAFEAKETKKDPRISDLVTWYCDRHLADLGRAPNTIKKYQSVLGNFEVFCKARHVGRVSQLSYERITEFLDWLASFVDGKLHRGAPQVKGHTHGYRDDCKSIIRGWLNAAIEAGRVESPPIAKWFIVKGGEEEPDTFALTPKELRLCLKTVDEEAPTISNIIRFMAHTGTRPSDALDLRWSQVNMAEGYARRKQVKTKNLATYSLNQDALEALNAEHERRAEKASFVFTNTFHKPYTYNTIYLIFTRALARVGFTVERDGAERTVNLKCLRHTYGTLMAHLGCPPFLLQRQMGHTRIETTLRYYHVDPAEGLKWAVKFSESIAQEEASANQETTENPVTPRHSPKKPTPIKRK